MPKFIVRVPELHTSRYQVEAESEEAALEMYEDGPVEFWNGYLDTLDEGKAHGYEVTAERVEEGGEG